METVRFWGGVLRRHQRISSLGFLSGLLDSTYIRLDKSFCQYIAKGFLISELTSSSIEAAPTHGGAGLNLTATAAGDASARVTDQG
jgi:hypothetical protein